MRSGNYGATPTRPARDLPAAWPRNNSADLQLSCKMRVKIDGEGRLRCYGASGLPTIDRFATSTS